MQSKQSPKVDAKRIYMLGNRAASRRTRWYYSNFLDNQPPINNSKMHIVQTPRTLFVRPLQIHPPLIPYSTKARAAAATTAPTDPATWLAAPLNEDGVGVPVTTPVPFVAKLLTIKDGQGVVSIAGAVRVIILSAGADGQEVPQGAEMVVVADYDPVSRCSFSFLVEGKWSRIEQITWALTPTTTRARAAMKNFMVSMGILNVEGWSMSESEKSVGMAVGVKD